MGKSSYKDPPTRPTRASKDDGKSPGDSTPSLYPRRFPRLGSGFQVKIPKQAETAVVESNTIGNRPKPVLMSDEVPFRTQTEVETGRTEASDLMYQYAGIDEKGNFPSSRVGSSSPAVGYEYHSTTTRRGGRLLHRPNDQSDQFLSFSQPLLLQLPQQQSQQSRQGETVDATTQQWSEDAVKWYASASSPAKTVTASHPTAAASGTVFSNSCGGRFRRIRLKRPRSFDENTAGPEGNKGITKAQAIPFPTFYRRPAKRQNTNTLVHTEQDETLLEYQWTHHQQEMQQPGFGSEDTQCTHLSQAEWKLLVDLTAGRACSSIRARRRRSKRRLEEENADTLIEETSQKAVHCDVDADQLQISQASPSQALSSLTWRQLYEEEGVERMVGDFRKEPVSCYPHNSFVKSDESSSSKEGAHTTTIPITLSKMITTQSKNPLEKQKEVALKFPKQMNDVNDTKAVWKAVYAVGQAYERLLKPNSAEAIEATSTTPVATVLRLSDIVALLCHAYQLPPPEDVFKDETGVSTGDNESSSVGTATSPSLAGAIDSTMGALLGACRRAWREQAKLMDLWHEEGVDTDSLAKQLDAITAPKTGAGSLGVQLDCLPDLRPHLQVVIKWQASVDALLKSLEKGTTNKDEPSQPRNDLILLESKVSEAKRHSFRSKGLLALENRLQRAYELRERIRWWQRAFPSCGFGANATPKESIKFVLAVVRDINRLKLTFPEGVSMLEFHRSQDSWIDRANVAIRSRISLPEIKSLIETGQAMPVDLSEYLEKLCSRVCLAEDWMGRFHASVPPPSPCNSGIGNISKLQWMHCIRRELKKGHRSLLHELASEGSRIPVEVDYVHLLQVELDARNWSVKAKKWIPGPETDEVSFKKGKLEDLREHMAKAASLRDKLVLSCQEERKAWVLEGEAEISAILQAADEWFERNKPYFQADSRSRNSNNSSRTCVSIHKLRQIVADADAIHANLGNSSSKISKILSQAETWHSKHASLLAQCGLSTSKQDVTSLVKTDLSRQASTLPLEQPKGFVKLGDMVEAIEEADSCVSSMDLEESVQLQHLVDKIKGWLERVSFAAGTKRQRRGKKNMMTFSVADLQNLIDQAATLPVDCSKEVSQLEQLLSSIRSWRSRAERELLQICNGFDRLRQTTNAAYGPPLQFSQRRASHKSQNSPVNCQQGGIVREKETGTTKNEKDDPMDTKADAASNCGSVVSRARSEFHSSSGGTVIGDTTTANEVQTLIKAFLKESSRFSCIVTPAGETAVQLEAVSRWCSKSIRYLETQRDVFDKRFFGAFDRFIAEGKDLVKLSREGNSVSSTSQEAGKTDPSLPFPIDDHDLIGNGGNGDTILVSRLCSSWGGFVADQDQRLGILLAERERFCQWCNKVEQVLFSDDRRLTPIDKLRELAAQSHDFPEDIGCDTTVQRVRSLVDKANAWIDTAAKTLDQCKVAPKLTMQGAKSLCDEGEKLSVQCTELRLLRSAIKAARSFATRVKRCKVEQGKTQVAAIRSLIDEHDALLVEMPDERTKLRKAMRNYCICRRPYEGFMIGCDDCDEWYHGPCIGVSESRAGKFDKYVCVRCCVKRCFKAGSSNVAFVVRKWTSEKDLKKQRQGEAQKHQRKVRKENKDIEKLQSEINSIREQLSRVQQKTSSPVASAGLHMDDSSGVVAYSDADCSGATLLICREQQCHSPMKASTVVSQSGVVCEGRPAKTSPSPKADAAMPRGVIPPEASLSECIVNGKISIDDGSGCMEEASSVPALDDGGGAILTSKLEKLNASIQECQSRLSVLADIAEARKKRQAHEDSKALAWKIWSIRVRSKVLVPSSSEQAQRSFPDYRDGSLSNPMLEIMEEARTLGLHLFEDVDVVHNGFKSMAWSLRSMAVLSRRPSFAVIQSLLAQASTFQLADEKAARMMRSMAQRATSWENKVSRALAPVPGEKKPFSLDVLKDLAHAGEGIPLHMPFKPRLSTVIEDKGARHCVCGGPSDGRFMLACDHCGRWFHGHCVKVTKEASDNLHVWQCPPCAGSPPDADSLSLDQFHNNFDVDTDPESSSQDDEDDTSSGGPDPETMWPPYGLLGSTESEAVLGGACCAIPDDAGLIESSAEGPPSNHQGHSVQLAREPLEQEPLLASETQCALTSTFRKDMFIQSPPIISSVLPAASAVVASRNALLPCVRSPGPFLHVLPTVDKAVNDEDPSISVARLTGVNSHCGNGEPARNTSSRLCEASDPGEISPDDTAPFSTSASNSFSDKEETKRQIQPNEGKSIALAADMSQPADGKTSAQEGTPHIDLSSASLKVFNPVGDKVATQMPLQAEGASLVMTGTVSAPVDVGSSKSGLVVNQMIHKIDQSCASVAASSQSESSTRLRYDRLSSESTVSDRSEDLYRRDHLGPVVPDVLVAPIKENGYD